MNANVTYEAAFTPADEEVTVIRSARAGVSGLSDEFDATNLETAERALFNAGYLLASPWSEPSSNGDRWCTLTRMT
ncbi:hypothetical protein DBP19_36240 [Streptomyces sp. CS090A]|uniref:hypothetical protein n=1 Tax=Streptomyces sp. CS090A TaxID=2162710 RepID=UPI000D520CF3|nr:hypothetical protein [Streptomyces sp. CS090A]PVC80590.1 hypothetical protein DBP19_36240 [Streptomyces sp. CS090A]